MLSKQEINKIFHEVYLEDNYNFLEDDLEKLAKKKESKPKTTRKKATPKKNGKK